MNQSCFIQSASPRLLMLFITGSVLNMRITKFKWKFECLTGLNNAMTLISDITIQKEYKSILGRETKPRH